MSAILIITHFFPLITFLGEIIKFYLQQGDFLENLMHAYFKQRNKS